MSNSALLQLINERRTSSFSSDSILTTTPRPILLNETSSKEPAKHADDDDNYWSTTLETARPTQNPSLKEDFTNNWIDDEVNWNNVSTSITTQPRRDRLYVGEKFGVNQTLVSENGRYEASLEKDGKLVIKERGSNQSVLTVGSGGRNGVQEIELLPDSRLILRVNNSNSQGLSINYRVPLVLYPREDCRGDPRSCLVRIQDDGNLVIIREKPHDRYSFFSAWHSKIYIQISVINF